MVLQTEELGGGTSSYLLVVTYTFFIPFVGCGYF
jgi:hypothetical protein